MDLAKLNWTQREYHPDSIEAKLIANMERVTRKMEEDAAAFRERMDRYMPPMPDMTSVMDIPGFVPDDPMQQMQSAWDKLTEDQRQQFLRENIAIEWTIST